MGIGRKLRESYERAIAPAVVFDVLITTLSEFIEFSGTLGPDGSAFWFRGHGQYQ